MDQHLQSWCHQCLDSQHWFALATYILHVWRTLLLTWPWVNEQWKNSWSRYQRNVVMKISEPNWDILDWCSSTIMKSLLKRQFTEYRYSHATKQLSRKVVFVNTPGWAAKEDRVSLLKPFDQIQYMDDDLEDIYQTSLLDLYAARPLRSTQPDVH